MASGGGNILNSHADTSITGNTFLMIILMVRIPMPQEEMVQLFRCSFTILTSSGQIVVVLLVLVVQRQ